MRVSHFSSSSSSSSWMTRLVMFVLVADSGRLRWLVTLLALHCCRWRISDVQRRLGVKRRPAIGRRYHSVGQTQQRHGRQNHSQTEYRLHGHVTTPRDVTSREPVDPKTHAVERIRPPNLQKRKNTTISAISCTTRSQAVARIADRTASQHLWGHVTSSVTWPFNSPYVISYWWSFGTESLSHLWRFPRYSMSNVTQWLNGWRDLETTSEQRSRSFILVPIDFLYATSYRL